MGASRRLSPLQGNLVASGELLGVGGHLAEVDAGDVHIGQGYLPALALAPPVPLVELQLLAEFALEGAEGHPALGRADVGTGFQQLVVVGEGEFLLVVVHGRSPRAGSRAAPSPRAAGGAGEAGAG